MLKTCNEQRRILARTKRSFINKCVKGTVTAKLVHFDFAKQRNWKVQGVARYFCFTPLRIYKDLK